MNHVPQYPRSTPRHHRAATLPCPLAGALVRGYGCIGRCEHAEEQGEGAVWFTCALLDKEAAPHE